MIVSVSISIIGCDAAHMRMTPNAARCEACGRDVHRVGAKACHRFVQTHGILIIVEQST